jgi:hypothetical protein
LLRRQLRNGCRSCTPVTADNISSNASRNSPDSRQPSFVEKANQITLAVHVVETLALTPTTRLLLAAVKLDRVKQRDQIICVPSSHCTPIC